MKIGIQTQFNQLNYGGVIQAYALYNYLVRNGYSVEMMNYWMDDRNFNLLYTDAERGILGVLKNIYRRCFYFGVRQREVRSRKTRHFISSHFVVSKFPFRKWGDINPKISDLGLVIVGSDQVWNCDSEVELFANLVYPPPKGASVISYAASFGKTELRENQLIRFQELLPKFSKISVREASGLDVLKQIGVSGSRVLDPTLLVNKSLWEDLVGEVAPVPGRVFCYLMSEDPLTAIEALSSQNDFTDAYIFVDCLIKGPLFKPVNFNYWIRTRKALKKDKRIHLCLSESPEQFLSMIKSSGTVITDSFHASVFSMIWGKQLKVVRPSTPWRMKMFSRISELSSYIEGQYIFDSLKSAVGDIGNTSLMGIREDRLLEDRRKSRDWLSAAINDCL